MKTLYKYQGNNINILMIKDSSSIYFIIGDKIKAFNSRRARSMARKVITDMLANIKCDRPANVAVANLSQELKLIANNSL